MTAQPNPLEAVERLEQAPVEGLMLRGVALEPLVCLNLSERDALISTLRSQAEALREAEVHLVDCSEYLDGLADADGDSEGFHPNREMTLKSGVDRALEMIDPLVPARAALTPEVKS